MAKFVPTTRIKCGLPTIEQIPMDRLSILQYALLELNKSMQDLRTEANRTRHDQVSAGGFDYRYGVFNGIRFGFSSIVIFKAGVDDYDLFSDQVMAYENEIQFLWSKYLDGSTQ